MNSIQRYRIVLLTFILIFSIGFVPVMAEEDQSATPNEASEVTELSVYQVDLWDYTPLFQAYVDEVNPNVKINIYSLTLAEYEDQLKISLASGDTPDIFLIPNWILSSFNTNDGLFADLKKINATTVADLQANTVKGVWNTVNPAGSNGVSYIPLQSSPNVLYYRTDLFKQAGLPIKPNLVEAKLNSWNALASAGKAFVSKTKKPLLGQPEAIFDSMVQLKNPIYFNKQGSYIGDSNPQIKKSYDFVIKGMKDGWIGKYEAPTTAWEKAIKNGSIGAIIGDHSTAQLLKQFMPKGSGKWAVASLPESSFDPGILSAAIPQNKPNEQLSLELIQWLSGAGPQNWAFNEFDFFPASLEALKETEWLNSPDAYFGKQKINQWLVKSVTTAKPYYLYQSNSLVPHYSFSDALLQFVKNPKLDSAKLWATVLKEAKAATSK